MKYLIFIFLLFCLEFIFSQELSYQPILSFMETTYLDDEISNNQLKDIREFRINNDTTKLFKVAQCNFLYYPYHGKVVDVRNFGNTFNDITSLFLFNSRPRDVFCFTNIIVINNVNGIEKYPDMCYRIVE